MASFPRRQFLSTAAAGGAFLGLNQFDFLGRLPRVSAEEAKPNPEAVQFNPDIEPLVRLLEETPRDQLLEKVAQRVQSGTSYQEVLAALLLAGVRNVQPRPSVGHKFHAVLVVNSAHIASIASPDSERWLPIFWALDHFKSSQARDVEEGNWTMGPVNEDKLPPMRRARREFTEAMDNWDAEKADTAVAALSRGATSGEMFELFARYGARDFRSIGHKAIYVANAWRTLNCIGWRHAEPVMRSLTYALLNHVGEPNPAENDLAPDAPGRSNESRVAQIKRGWKDGELNDQATTELLGLLRTGSVDEVCDSVVETVNSGVSPRSVYDALLLGSGELLMRQPGIVALHAVTSTNAFWYAYNTTRNDETRRKILLQNAAFLPLFREAMQSRGKVGDAQLDQLAGAMPGDTPLGDSTAAIEAIFDRVGSDSAAAAQGVLAYLDAGQRPEELITAARRLVFLKGSNSHDYKFSSAVLEDYYHVSPNWRNRFLASSVYKLLGSGQRDNQLVERTRSALA